ncbi:MAG: helix-turn-helix transcriptional regulator [Blastochloris sp.]|nr:helix-turn-helix transcriptional regulator [Blastochloris sp.]
MVERHQRINDAAWTLFTQRGYPQVTIDDIAAELGMSKKTLYAATPSEEALLHRLVQARLEEAEAYNAEMVNFPVLGWEFNMITM